MYDLLKLSNPVFSNYVFYGSVVAVKMLAMAPIVSIQRARYKVFASPEDAKFMKVEKKEPSSEEVDRVRRIHMNDLENIPIFLAIGLFYVATDPKPTIALIHFRLFALSRIMHSISYKLALPPPTRGICFLVGIGVCFSMAVRVLRYGSCH